MIDLDDDGGGGDEGAPAWMATFSDLATLLLTFFVLLLSFAEMNVKEFKEMLGSVRNAFGVAVVKSGPHEARSTTPVELSTSQSSSKLALTERETMALEMVRKAIRDRNLQEDVEVLLTPEEVIVRLKDRVLFAIGSEKLSSEGGPVLERVAELAAVFTDGVSIEGHTDDVPINTSKFPSNWELSTARAAAVLRHLTREGPLPVSKVRVSGYADTRPIAPNDSDENRARNRRVEFVFERPQRTPKSTLPQIPVPLAEPDSL